MDFRIGHGYDVHRLEEGLPLKLGGVAIPYDKGFSAHSDGDVLLHALCDAMLGAAAIGDIGLHFPDTSAEYKGADSLRLLAETVRKTAREGFSVVNADMTVIIQAPRLRPHIDRMRANIARTLGVDISCVSVKATTEERLGFTGSGEGVAAHAVVLLSRRQPTRIPGDDCPACDI